MLPKYTRTVLTCLLAGIIGGGFIAIAGTLVPACHAQGLTSSGTEFWLGFFPNEPVNTDTSLTEFFLAATAADTALVTFDGATTAYPLSANSVATVDLHGRGITDVSEDPSNNSVHIQTHSPITVYGYFDKYGAGEGGSPDGYLGLPVAALGTDYYTINYTEDNNFDGIETAEFLVIAAYDSTTVTITTTSHTQDMFGNLSHSPGDTWSVVLMKGQSYLVQSSGQFSTIDDLTGSHVVGSKPIALFTGHQMADIPLSMQSADYLIEMMTPDDTWGTQYFEMPMAGRTVCGDYIRILSAQDSNVITTNGTTIATLNAGQWIEQNVVTTPQLYASSSDKRFIVAQYSYSNHYLGDPGNADPFLVLLTPREDFENLILFRTPPPAQGPSFTNYVTILAPPDSMGFISINGKPATSYTSAGQASFAGSNPPIGALRLQLPDGSNSYLATSTVKFGMYQYGVSDYEGYGWPAGMALNRVSVDTLPPAQTITSSNCGDYDVTLTETRHPPQYSFTDSRIAQIAFITQSGDPRWSKPSFNYTYTLNSSFQPGDSTASFSLTLIDPTKPAYAAIWTVDYAGNDTVYQYTNDSASSNAVELLSYSNTGSVSVLPETRIDAYLTVNNFGSAKSSLTGLNATLETDGTDLIFDTAIGMDGWMVTQTVVNSGETQLNCVPTAGSTRNPGEKIADLKYNTFINSNKATIQLSDIEIDTGNGSTNPCGGTSFTVQFHGSNELMDVASSASGNVVLNLTTSPNPAHGIVTVTTSVPEGTFASLKLYNALGECLNSFDVNSGDGQTLNIYGLMSGIYFLRLEAPGATAAMREFVVE